MTAMTTIGTMVTARLDGIRLYASDITLSVRAGGIMEDARTILKRGTFVYSIH